MIYVDGNIQQYYNIIANINVDYKEQLVGISIKLRIQYFICQVSSMQYDNLYETWALKIYKSTWVQSALSDIGELIKNHGYKDLNNIYLIKNFVQNPLFINIYAYRIFDILYQMLKKVAGDMYIL